MKDIGFYNVAIVGASGAVGREILKVLEERDFPIDKLKLLASERSIGITLNYKGEEINIDVLDEDSFHTIDIALFSAGGSISNEFAPIAARAGAVVIDNTAAFRMEDDIPLVVPEVNPEAVKMFKTRNIIANPNCTTIQLVVALNPIYRAKGLKSVRVSTYQAVSGAGQKAMQELSSQISALYNQRPIEMKVFDYQIAFNCIPQIGDIKEDGYSTEEIKIINETKKILDDDKIKVSATAIRVPTFSGHGESVTVETQKLLKIENLKEMFRKSPGLMVVDEPEKGILPLPIDATGQDITMVGRIRRDKILKNGINMWIVADNLRKGAATNAVQIAELLIKQGLIRGHSPTSYAYH